MDYEIADVNVNDEAGDVLTSAEVLWAQVNGEGEMRSR